MGSPRPARVQLAAVFVLADGGPEDGAARGHSHSPRESRHFTNRAGKIGPPYGVEPHASAVGLKGFKQRRIPCDLGCTLQGMSLGSWLQAQLFERRIVLVSGRLDTDAAARAAAALLTLDASENRPIELHLDSPGGALGAAFVLVDTADTLRSELRVLCRGQVGGPAIAVVTAADHRAAAPHVRFHLTQPTARFTGTPEEIAAQSRHEQDLLWRLYGHLARRTGRPAEEIAEHMRRGRYLDAREALDYGLIDEITSGR
jgi:ATP-dependent Clp protease protease subunit